MPYSITAVFVEEDEELIQLQEEDYRVRLEEEELIAIGITTIA